MGVALSLALVATTISPNTDLPKESKIEKALEDYWYERGCSDIADAIDTVNYFRFQKVFTKTFGIKPSDAFQLVKNNQKRS